MQNIPTFYPTSDTDLRSDYERSLEEHLARRRRIVQEQLDDSGQGARTDLAGVMRRAERMR